MFISTIERFQKELLKRQNHESVFLNYSFINLLCYVLTIIVPVNKHIKIK